MKNILLYIVLMVSLIACKTKETIRYVPVKESHTEEVIVRDTIIDVQLIPYRDSISLADTLSYLENKYAYSYAHYSKNRLNHSLTIKEVKIPTQIQYIERIVKDSVQIPIQVKGDNIIVYKRGLFWWVGIVSLFIIAGFIFLKVYRVIV